MLALGGCTPAAGAAPGAPVATTAVTATPPPPIASATAENPPIIAEAETPDVEVALEERLGIRLALVALTAGDGLIDVRFTVVDADKAALLLEEGNLPVLIPPEGEVVARVRPPQYWRRFEAGRTYYVLAPNPEGAIKPGSTVIVAFGDLLLERVVQ